MKTILAALLILVSAAGAAQAEGCTIIADLKSDAVLLESGPDCDTRLPPASTFKVPLAVLGFDAGILVGADNPAWPYRDEYRANRAVDKTTTGPARWLSESVLWYSRVLVAELGAERFADGVARLDYGNMDVSGDPGANNGMTRAWLTSSLQISPREQARFIARLRLSTLSVAREAQQATLAIMPRFSAGDWAVYGKTGSAYERAASGKLDYDKQLGWFVGWMEREDRVLVFALFDRFGGDVAAGPALRDRFIEELPTLLADL